MQRSLIFIVLVLASLHCGRAMLYDNVSYLDLQKYELGQERMPFQGRVLMMPLMRMAHSSAAMIRISKSPHEKRVMTAERPDPEKVLSTLIACACVAGMGLLGTWEAIRLRLPWWLPWTLTLVILFVSYASRSEQNFWYPYDAPEFLLFSLGTVFVVQQRYWLLLLLMPIIAANRETAIFLAVLWLFVDWNRERPWPAVLRTSLLLVPYAAIYLAIAHYFAHQPSITGPRMAENLRALRSPKYWPQLTSAFGYLWVVLLLFWKRLSQISRRLLLGLLPCVLVTLFFGVWFESRIFGEFTLAVALLCSEIFASVYLNRGSVPPPEPKLAPQA
jgi:hypothetical protein